MELLKTGQTLLPDSEEFEFEGIRVTARYSGQSMAGAMDRIKKILFEQQSDSRSARIFENLVEL